MQHTPDQNLDSETIKARYGTISGVAKNLIKFSSTTTAERYFLDPKPGIRFSQKVSLLKEYFFLRTFNNLKDLDEATDMIRKVLLMGERTLQNKANNWMSENDSSLDIHQTIRKDMHLAEIIDEVFGASLDLGDADMVDIFRKCRKDSQESSVKSGLLGLMRGKRTRTYESETDNAIEYLRKMQTGYEEFLVKVGIDYDNMERTEFFQKYTYKIE